MNIVSCVDQEATVMRQLPSAVLLVSVMDMEIKSLESVTQEQDIVSARITLPD